VGFAVGGVLGLDVEDRKGRDARRVKKLLGQWISNGALKKVDRRCEKSRRDKPFVVVGDPVLSGCVTSSGAGDAV
jgi:hypothetical protein